MLGWCLVLAAAARPALAQAESDDSDGPTSPGVSVIPLPVIAYSPETKLQLGVAAVTVLRPQLEQQRATSFKTVAIYSTNHSATLEFELEAFLLDDRVFLGTRLELQHMPSTLFGIGNHTDLDDAEDFTRSTLTAETLPMYAAARYIYLGPIAKLDLYDLDERQEGGLLDSDAVLGARSGRDLGVGIASRYDSRDHSVGPMAGHLLKASARAHHGLTGSQFAYERYGLEARTYARLYREQVLAVAASAAVLRGSVPYFNLLKLGGWESLRGHFGGRYRDKTRVMLQAEYRVPIVWRIGAVGFGGVGDVGSSPGGLLSHGLKFSVGGGLRLLLDADARVNLAIDFGYAGDQTGLYVELGEAF